MEKAGHNVFTLYKSLAVESMKPNKLKRRLDTLQGESGEKPEFFHRKLNEFNKRNKHSQKLKKKKTYIKAIKAI
jgi:hypothetical protein